MNYIFEKHECVKPNDSSVFA